MFYANIVLCRWCFSALQRAEIAEIRYEFRSVSHSQNCFSALQRAEIAEIWRWQRAVGGDVDGFSALQRAEIAEICGQKPNVESSS